MAGRADVLPRPATIERPFTRSNACSLSCRSPLVLRVLCGQVVGDEEIKKFARYSYPSMTKTQGNFKLSVRAPACTALA